MVIKKYKPGSLRPLFPYAVVVVAVLVLVVMFTGSETQGSGPFPHPDGVYEGASDLYD